MRRHTTEEVRIIIEKEGYSLISEEYISGHKIRVECNEQHGQRHQYETRLDKFKSGHRCPHCYHESQKLSHEYVQSKFAEQGYTLLESNYKNLYTKMLVECNGRYGVKHQYVVSFDHFQQGHRCPQCLRIQQTNTLDYVRKQVEKRECVLISQSYISNKDKLKIQCRQGHVFSTTFSYFETSNGKCTKCTHMQRSQDQREKAIQFLTKIGYSLDEDEQWTYHNITSKIAVKCSKGHKYLTTLTNLYDKHKCSRCQEWKRQQLLGTILETFFSEYDIVPQDNLGFLGRQRVDYSIRQLRLAFEYDGEQHFQPVCFKGVSKKVAAMNFIRQQKWDTRKNNLCKKNQYKLIRIAYFEDLTTEVIREKYERTINNDIPTTNIITLL